MQHSNESTGRPPGAPAQGDWSFEPSSGPGSTGPTGQTDAAPDTFSPAGDDYSSSAAPIGEGSNTPVGAEPDTFRAWDARQPDAEYGDHGTFGTIGQALPWGGGAATTGVVGWAAYSWWRRRRQRRTRAEQLRRTLILAGRTAATRMPRYLPKDLPKNIGKAASRTKSPWTPFLLLPVALWLRSQGGKPARAADQLLEPLKLEDRTQRFAREAAKVVEREGTRAIRERELLEEDRGWGGYYPWLLAVPLVGGGYYAYQRLVGTGSSGDGGSLGISGRSVRDVMTTGAEVIAPDASAADAARKMRDLNVGSLPVCDGDRLIGVVTDRDLSVRAVAEGKDANETRVRQVMSPEVTWVFEDEPADMAASMMRQRQVRRLPVLNRDDKLVGIVALADLATDLTDDALKSETLEGISEPGRANGR